MSPYVFIGRGRGAQPAEYFSQPLVYFRESNATYYQADYDGANPTLVVASGRSGTITDLKFDNTYERILATFTDGIEIIDFTLGGPDIGTFGAGNDYRGIDYDRDLGKYYVNQYNGLDPNPSTIHSIPWQLNFADTKAAGLTLEYTEINNRPWWGLSMMDRNQCYDDGAKRANIWFLLVSGSNVDGPKSYRDAGTWSGITQFGSLPANTNNYGQTYTSAKEGEHHTAGWARSPGNETGIVCFSQGRAGTTNRPDMINLASIGAGYSHLGLLGTALGGTTNFHATICPIDWTLWVRTDSSAPWSRLWSFPIIPDGSQRPIPDTGASVIRDSAPVYRRFTLVERIYKNSPPP